MPKLMPKPKYKKTLNSKIKTKPNQNQHEQPSTNNHTDKTNVVEAAREYDRNCNMPTNYQKPKINQCGRNCRMS